MSGLHPPSTRALPNLVVIGAMKCGTTALHNYLDTHPDITMAPAKELCFFYDAPAGLRGGDWSPGNRHRGVEWYASHFRADAAVRGETSPGYTSPAHLEVAERMSMLLPDARLVLLVRDPVARAVSQYRHHAAEGTERRSPAEALLDPASQYLSRSRYHERLAPFLAHFPLAQIKVVAAEDLDSDRRGTMRDLFRFVGVDPEHWSAALSDRHHEGRGAPPELPAALRDRLSAELRPDADRLRSLLGREFPWAL